VQDAHLVERQAERVRRDLRHHRFKTLPDCSRADIDRHGSIRRKVEPRRLLRTQPAALDKAGDGNARRSAQGSVAPVVTVGTPAEGPCDAAVLSDLDPELHGLLLGVPSGVPAHGVRCSPAPTPGSGSSSRT